MENIQKKHLNNFINTTSNKVEMIAKIFILTMLIASICMSTASPIVEEGEFPKFPSITESAATEVETENQVNESVSVFAQNSPSQYGYLTVIVKYARGLDDTDGWWNLPDPYAVVDAYYMEGAMYKRSTDQTGVVSGPQYPSWRKTMEFDWANWIDFTIRVMDSDVGSDDVMMEAFTIYVSPGVFCTQEHDSNGDGRVTYDYFFQTNEDDRCSRTVPTCNN